MKAFRKEIDQKFKKFYSKEKCFIYNYKSDSTKFYLLYGKNYTMVILNSFIFSD